MRLNSLREIIKPVMDAKALEKKSNNNQMIQEIEEKELY